MPLLAHATLADLQAWTGTAPPAGADRLIRRASELMDAYITATYTADVDTGLATDPLIAIAIRDATCAQVESWIAGDEYNDIAGLGGTQVAAAGYQARRPPTFSPRAERLLNNVGLISAPVVTAGSGWRETWAEF